MKANEILVESTEELNEAPVGALSRLFTNIGAKMGLSGSQIQKEVNDELMQVRRELNPILRSSGGSISVQDMISFLRGKGYSSDAEKIIKAVKKQNRSKPSDPLTTQEIDRVIEQSVVRGYAEKGGMGTGRYGTKTKKGAEFMRNPKTASRDRDRENQAFAGEFGKNRRGSNASKQEQMKSFAQFFKTLSAEERKMFSDMLKEK